MPSKGSDCFVLAWHVARVHLEIAPRMWDWCATVSRGKAASAAVVCFSFSLSTGVVLFPEVSSGSLQQSVCEKVVGFWTGLGAVV